jgi:GNAT superfamily N-acetyltransferase
LSGAQESAGGNKSADQILLGRLTVRRASAAKIDMQIRKAVEADIPNLLPLMRELAVFENYDKAFAITEEILREQGFRRSPPDFHCLVAEENNQLIGLAVYYFVPFTYRAKPNVILKELYVADGHRSEGVGKLLMKALAQEAERIGCGMIKWWVAKWNERGIEFYERLGAKIDPDWHEFQMSEEAFRDLAGS